MSNTVLSILRRHTLPLAAAVLCAVAVAGCGSSSSSSSSSSGSSAGNGSGGKMGGTATILETAGGVDSLDPGYWYYQTDYTDLGQTTERTLYGFTPTGTAPTPDLASGMPQISDGGKTITIHLRPGIHYGPPLAKRTVSSADIKYAMERCFLSQVGNGYSAVYYSEIVGAPAAPQSKLPDITGLQAPNPTTLVIKTKVPVGVLADANALALPCTVPVPQSYAAKYDQGSQSTYGNHVVAVGPYMIKGSGNGSVSGTGYENGKLLVLVRNPSWRRSSDPIRHAYFDSIVFKGGFDSTLASQKTLSGQNMLSGDYAVPPTTVLQDAVQNRRSQVQIAPSGGNRYIGLNSKVHPLDNVNFRRAIAAVINRVALQKTRGGPAVGTIATHFIPPQMPGFADAGGTAGPGYDFFANPQGNLKLAESYMKKAGYPSGRYNGPPLLTVADNEAPASDTAQAVQSQLAQLGINLTFREVPHATMLSKFCEVPKAAVAICPTLGWGKDFFDSQSMIDPVFNGKNIVPSGNTNISQANDPALNAQMDAAERLTDPTQRAAAWGKLDKEITGQVFVVPWLWDNEVGLTSSNVRGVQWSFNGNDWDLTNSSLK